MAYKFNPISSQLDLIKNNVKVVSDDPVSGNDGDIILNTSTSILKVYLNGVWETIQTFTGFLLMESEDYLLLESGDKIQKE